MALFFTYKKQDHINGPGVEDIKATFERICEHLKDGTYDSGIDAYTMCDTMNGLYKYITNTSKGKAMHDVTLKMVTTWIETSCYSPLHCRIIRLFWATLG